MLYEIGTKVYCKSYGAVGKISEANYGPHRKAVYVVLFKEGSRTYDYLTGSDDLRRADRCCDGCGKWLPHSSFNGGECAAGEPDGDDYWFCFLCTREVYWFNDLTRP